MRCPKCGTEQPDATVCGACGVIIAKATDRVRPPQRRHPREQPTGGPSSTWIWVVGAAVLLLCGLFWGISALDEEPQETITSRPATPITPEAGGAQDPALTPPVPGAKAGIELDREAVPAVTSTWYEGADGWAEARAEQRINGAPLALYVRVGWCPHCRHFEAKVLPDDAVQGQLGRVIKVRLDPERSDEEKRLADGLGVTGYPTFRLLGEPDGQPVRLPAGSSVDAAAFSKMLDEDLTRIARQWVSSVRDQSSDEALGILDRAVRLAPDDAWTHLGRGQHLTRRGAYRQALDDLREATRLAPDEPIAHDALGYCLMRQNRFSDALLVYDHLAQTATGDQAARAIYMRGVCQKKLGRTDAAIRDAKMACDLGNATACQVVGRH